MDPKELERNPEFAALQDIEGVDKDDLRQQAGLDDTPPVDTPPVDTPPVVDPPVVDPPVVDPPEKTPPPQPGPQDAFLKEIFGDRFKTVEEAKSANIVGTLDEVESLRTAKTDLTTKLDAKPKTNFANDEVAVYNEFVKETGIQNFGVFQKINSAELATMDSMEALITQYMFDHPEQTGKEAQVQKFFEKKYNVDPDLVDEQEMAINKVGLDADGTGARAKLQGVKDKLIVPEAEEESPTTPKVMTPEEKTTLKTSWGNTGTQISNSLAKLKIPIKNSKDPLLDYEIPESEQKEIQNFVADYAAENQLELNDDNAKMIQTLVYNQLMINKLPEIAHSIFEKARSMTEDQVTSLYENPSPQRNTDTPPAKPGDTRTEFEKTADEAFEAEMKRFD